MTGIIPKIRVNNDVTFNLKLIDSQVAVDWRSVTQLHVEMLSVSQMMIAGSCVVEVDKKDPTILHCKYPASEPQYLGVYRVAVACELEGMAKAYDTPIVEFVSSTSEEGSSTVTIPDTELTSGDISSSLISAILHQCVEATGLANDAIVAMGDVELEVSEAEALRKESETKRVNAETSRVNAENNRVLAEDARVKNEKARSNSELERGKFETQRKEAEKTRQDNESNRTTNESRRKTAETNRVLAEDARIEAENSRTTAEDARVEAERLRGSSEDGRVLAENQRATDSAAAIKAANDAAAKADSKLTDVEALKAALEEQKRLNSQLIAERDSLLKSLDHAGNHHALSYDSEFGFKVCGRPERLYGHGVPSVDTIPEQKGIPAFIGQIYINVDASANGLYYAKGSESVGDWKNA